MESCKELHRKHDDFKIRQSSCIQSQRLVDFYNHRTPENWWLTYIYRLKSRKGFTMSRDIQLLHSSRWIRDLSKWQIMYRKAPVLPFTLSISLQMSESSSQPKSGITYAGIARVSLRLRSSCAHHPAWQTLRLFNGYLHDHYMSQKRGPTGPDQIQRFNWCEVHGQSLATPDERVTAFSFHFCISYDNYCIPWWLSADTHSAVVFNAPFNVPLLFHRAHQATKARHPIKLQCCTYATLQSLLISIGSIHSYFGSTFRPSSLHPSAKPPGRRYAFIPLPDTVIHGRVILLCYQDLCLLLTCNGGTQCLRAIWGINDWQIMADYQSSIDIIFLLSQ
jgi:hypothetical protein